MRYREFGQTGWLVSEVGFGAWQIGGQWGNTDDDASVRLLLDAFEQGVNFVDTAQMYGEGRSEIVVGRAVANWQRAGGNRVYVATKIQPTVWPKPDEHGKMRGRYPAWHVRAGVDAALRRLQVDRIDLLQLHCWIEDGVESLDWLEALNELRIEGKIENIGVSIRDYRPQDGISLARLNLVQSQQVIFNIFEQTPASSLFNEGQNAYIARVPLDSGSLSGRWTPKTFDEWSADSVQKFMFRDERFPETLHRISNLKRDCEKFFDTLDEAAMRFVLSCSRVSTVIPGIGSIEDLKRNIGYSDGREFPGELIDLLKQHSWARNFYQ